MRRMSKQEKWYHVRRIFLDYNNQIGQGVESVCITRRDVMNRLGCTKRTAAKMLTEFVRSGLLDEDYIPNYGNFGLYEYWLSEATVDYLRDEKQ